MMYTSKAPGPAHTGPRRANWQQTPPQPRPRLFPFGWLWASGRGRGGGGGGGGEGPGGAFWGSQLGACSGFGAWGVGWFVIWWPPQTSRRPHHTLPPPAGNVNAPPPKMMHGPVPEWGSQPQALGFPNEAGDCRPLTHTRNRSGVAGHAFVVAPVFGAGPRSSQAAIRNYFANLAEFRVCSPPRAERCKVLQVQGV